MAIFTIENGEITKITAARANRLEIVGAEMKFTNFAGKASKYNAEGKRNFEIIIPEDAAEELYNAGWRIRKNGYDVNKDRRRTGDFDDKLEDCEYRLRVNVNLDGDNPPMCFKKTSTKMIPLDSKTIGSLDYAEINNVFVEINGYDAAKNGQLSGYLNKIVAEVADNKFDEIYGAFLSETNEDDTPFD